MKKMLTQVEFEPITFGATRQTKGSPRPECEINTDNLQRLSKSGLYSQCIYIYLVESFGVCLASQSEKKISSNPQHTVLCLEGHQLVRISFSLI